MTEQPIRHKLFKASYNYARTLLSMTRGNYYAKDVTCAYLSALINKIDKGNLFVIASKLPPNCQNKEATARFLTKSLRGFLQIALDMGNGFNHFEPRCSNYQKQYLELLKSILCHCSELYDQTNRIAIQAIERNTYDSLLKVR